MRYFRFLFPLVLFQLFVACGKEETAELSVTPLTMNVGADGGTSNLNITSNTNWSISDNADWITVSPANGSGNSIVTVTYLKNSTTDPLSASITITGTGIEAVVVTVNQSAGEEPLINISWTRKADLPVERGFLSPSASVVNGKIYVIGGNKADNIVANDVEEYDPASDKWTAKSPLLTQRWGHISGVVDGKIYVMGGCEAASGDALSSIEVYDPVLDKWENVGNMQTARIASGSCVVKGKIYVIGGRTKEPSGDYLTSVEVYDPVTNTWVTKSPLPQERGYLAVTATSNFIYAIGGVGSVDVFPKENVYKYDISADKWSEIPSMPYARWGIVSCLVDDMVVCVGGTSGPTDAGQKTSGIIFTQDDDFIKATSMSFGRYCCSTCVFNGKIYVFGGNNTPNFTPCSYTEEGIITLR